MTAHEDQCNIENVPSWVIYPFKICLQRLTHEERCLHLSMRGLHQLTLLPDVISLLSEIDLEDSCRPEREVAQRFETAQRDAKWINDETRAGHPALHAHSVVALWSSLEVLVEDAATAWLENRADAWDCEVVKRIKVPLTTFRQLDEPAIARLVVGEVARNTGASLCSGKTSFDAVLRPLDLAPRIGANLRSALHELCQVRHIIVHNGGMADLRFAEACPHLGLSPDDPVMIPHSLWGWYYLAATRFCERLLNKFLIRLGRPGCNCEGMDTIGERPEIQSDPQKRDA